MLFVVISTYRDTAYTLNGESAALGIARRFIPYGSSKERCHLDYGPTNCRYGIPLFSHFSELFVVDIVWHLMYTLKFDET